MTGKDRSSGGMYKLNPDSKTRRDRPSVLVKTGHPLEYTLRELSAQTGQPDEFSDRPVRAVLGHGCPTRGRTRLSEQIVPPINSSDKPVRRLVGRLCLRTARAGRSDDLLDRHVRAVR
ncbi:hypothetical protein PGT21_000444 [Puccinia graminis f. sp. tritici]|uniref:Uncharacterized protein n=1 Tax=Puccinia graminis f. sp. tritici TaxID=56615 RepID=A0A5B0LUF6_PUCGR|nr:hypothetical protein PGT21_025675 [Puccinia graminis f. sp. tritici]KAA1098724.1 hypothetical protein PGT21_000465 [Puccinia graminis f. sp. tritici]KAA1105266.1 hypothetical protein PGT21_000444 [Puccinia graminis f. sp. tritici]